MRQKTVENGTPPGIGNHLETISTHYRPVFPHIHHFFAPQPYSLTGIRKISVFQALDGNAL
jgi:hypothetical protein